MTDLHNHILPGVDDGAKTEQESIAMLCAQFEQGVDTVVLTPHYYPDREEPAAFLERRAEAAQRLEEAIAALPEEQQCRLPRRILGAEVAYLPGLHRMEGLQQLCIGSTKNMLLELPFYLWDQGLIRQLYDFLGHSGVTPVLAHIERYLFCQQKKLVEEVMDLGLPVQVGTDTIGHRLSPAMKLLRQGRGHLIASDCHDLIRRPPTLGAAMKAVGKKLGQERLEDLLEMADQLAMGE